MAVLGEKDDDKEQALTGPLKPRVVLAVSYHCQSLVPNTLTLFSVIL
jgi:hypothetical protein